MNFDAIYIESSVEEENEFYRIFYNPETPFMYTNNFLELLYQPSLEEFIIIESHLLDFIDEYELGHLRIVWPEDKGLTPPIIQYVEENGYGIEMLELYTIDPKNFKPSDFPDQISLSLVTEDTFDLFKALNYEEDEKISVEFAQLKEPLYEDKFANPNIHFILASWDDQPVGGVTIIETDATVEIDSLFVKEEWQRKGIGSAIQEFVMDFAKDRKVILEADADDTPREMYRKQGYEYEGFQIALLKVQ